MAGKILPKCLWLSLVALLLFPLPSFGAKEPKLLGEQGPNFTLPSTQDRLINYAEEYYGKYHLIITFFPAAFTPT
jgi:hypothetical protein